MANSGERDVEGFIDLTSSEYNPSPNNPQINHNEANAYINYGETSNSSGRAVRDTIDLTSPDTPDYSPSESVIQFHGSLRRLPRINNYDSGVFIDLVGESVQAKKRKSNTTRGRKRICTSSKEVQTDAVTELNYGECQICFDKLGKTSLESTTCGHLFCRSCLLTSLEYSQHCPKCRHTLIGESAHHPMYLEQG